VEAVYVTAIPDKPEEIPVTTPEEVPTVATEGSLLVQEIPGVAQLNTVVLPTHTVVMPVIGAGIGLTVTTAVFIQPVGTV
jgi:ADP-dependent phosphofructokinase/glucokinase